MNIQRVKQGAKITFYNGLYMVFVGIYFIIFIDFNMKLNFNSIYQLWTFFWRYNSKISYMFYLFNLILGISLISNGIFISYISNLIIRRKEKITWVILFVAGILTWAGLLIVSFLFKNILLIILSFIGWIFFIFGMIFPIKYYLQRESI